MRSLKWVVLILALFQGGWLAFDGTHALVTGDYITPASGPHAGQLGLWSHAVSAVGLEPRSTLVKCIQLFLGIAWLVALVVFIIRPMPGRRFILGCAAGSLWYLPVGTVVNLIIIVLILVLRRAA